MLRLNLFTFNDFRENTYLIINEQNEGWLVDPGMYYPSETQHLFRYIDDAKIQIKGIINTHTHIDHIFGVSAVKERYNVKFGMHQADQEVLEYAESSAAVFGINFQNTPVPDYFIKEGESLMLGDDALTVFHCPGHSPGSIVFYYQPGNWAIVGDVLFQGSIGRTDLPGGSFETLLHSIRTHLFTLPEETMVYPGHGAATTIGEEKRTNPYCREEA